MKTRSVLAGGSVRAFWIGREAKNGSGNRPGAWVGRPGKSAGERAQSKSKTWRTLLCLSAFLVLGVSARAQSFSLEWFTIDGGGGTSTGGVYSVSGTVGQPDANPQPLTGGNFSLVGGFWSLFAMQTPGAPLL